MTTRFEIVQTVDGEMITTRPADIFAWAEVAGLKAAPHGRTQLRAELQDAPKIAGLCGPMWGGTDAQGNPVVRYEDQRAYNAITGDSVSDHMRARRAMTR